MANLIEEYEVKVSAGAPAFVKPCAISGIEQNLLEIGNAQGETEAVIDYLLEILVGKVSLPLDPATDDALRNGKLNQLEQSSAWRHEQALRIQRKICELRDQLLD